MPTTCTNALSPDGKYIIQKIVGDITIPVILEHTKEGHIFGRGQGVNKYLMDLLESRNIDSIINIYNFAYHDIPSNPNIDQFAVVAVLVAPDDHSHDFVEVVTRNAGLNVTLFRDREAAVRFLIGE